MNQTNTTIILLTICAIILGTLVLTGYNTSTSQAATTSVKQSGYIMTLGAWSADTELLYMVDVPSKRLNVYGLNINTKKIELLPDAGVDLGKAFE
jgi:hypothetical protein